MLIYRYTLAIRYLATGEKYHYFFIIKISIIATHLATLLLCVILLPKKFSKNML